MAKRPTQDDVIDRVTGSFVSIKYLRLSNHNSVTFYAQPIRVMDLSLRTMILCVWVPMGSFLLHRVRALHERAFSQATAFSLMAVAVVGDRKRVICPTSKDLRGPGCLATYVASALHRMLASSCFASGIRVSVQYRKRIEYQSMKLLRSGFEMR